MSPAPAAVISWMSCGAKEKPMSKVRIDISVSLDGFVAGPDQSLDDPLGQGRRRPPRVGDGGLLVARTAWPGGGRGQRRLAGRRPRRSRAPAPRSWAGRCSAAARGRGSRIPTRRPGGATTRRFTHPVFVAHPPRARAGVVRQRHHLQLRHRRHRVGARAGARGGRRQGRADRRRRPDRRAVPRRRAGGRARAPRRPGAARQRRAAARQRRDRRTPGARPAWSTHRP